MIQTLIFNQVQNVEIVCEEKNKSVDLDLGAECMSYEDEGGGITHQVVEDAKKKKNTLRIEVSKHAANAKISIPKISGKVLVKRGKLNIDKVPVWSSSNLVDCIPKPNKEGAYGENAPKELFDNSSFLTLEDVTANINVCNNNIFLKQGTLVKISNLTGACVFAENAKQISLQTVDNGLIIGTNLDGQITFADVSDKNAYIVWTNKNGSSTHHKGGLMSKVPDLEEFKNRYHVNNSLAFFIYLMAYRKCTSAILPNYFDFSKAAVHLSLKDFMALKHVMDKDQLKKLAEDHATQEVLAQLNNKLN